MDEDQPLGHGPDHTPQRPHGLGRYLKRLRSAFRLRRSSKAPKRSATDHPGAIYDSRLLAPSETPFNLSLPPQPLRPHRPYTYPSDGQTEPPPPLTNPPAPTSLRSQTSAGQSPETHTNSFATSLSRSNSNPLPIQDYRVKRAADLFEKYGVDLDPDLCPYETRPATTGRLERVEKPIRMRLHHHCHHCSLAIGPTGVCVNCGHKLCKKCYRFPDEKKDAKPPEPKDKKRKAVSPSRSETLENWLVSTPSSSLAFRPATKGPAVSSVSALRRVRRLCHQCTAPFIWTERVCQDCDHEMCSMCPQDPPAATADPSGTPSLAPTQVIHQRDRIFKKPRLRLRYNCEQCGTLLQEKTDFCSRCGHLRCQNCKRNPPPRGPPPDSDPAKLEALQRRLDSCTTP